MSAGKEVRKKIKSIGNTQKITSAMEMVAASKMRKTQEQMQRSRPYVMQLLRLASHLSQATKEEYQHEYLTPRDVKRVGIIVVSSDRGLCGGLNNNLFKIVSESLAKWQKEGIEVDVATIGNKATTFFNRYGGNVIASDSVSDTPTSAELIGLTTTMLDRYRDGEIDELHVFSNIFVNTMTQQPVGTKLLPVVAESLEAHESVAEQEALSQTMSWDYVYDTAPEALIELVLDRYIEYVIYQSVVENIACEMAARMIAMKAASDNASDLIDELQLVYNKARQAAITQEISEIVGGAAAIN